MGRYFATSAPVGCAGGGWFAPGGFVGVYGSSARRQAEPPALALPLLCDTCCFSASTCFLGFGLRAGCVIRVLRALPRPPPGRPSDPSGRRNKQNQPGASEVGADECNPTLQNEGVEICASLEIVSSKRSCSGEELAYAPHQDQPT